MAAAAAARLPAPLCSEPTRSLLPAITWLGSRARPRSQRSKGSGWVAEFRTRLRVQPWKLGPACPPSSSLPGGTRCQSVAVFLAVLPMVPLGVAARWRRPAAEPGEGLWRPGGREVVGSGPLCCVPLSARCVVPAHPVSCCGEGWGGHGRARRAEERGDGGGGAGSQGDRGEQARRGVAPCVCFPKGR